MRALLLSLAVFAATPVLAEQAVERPEPRSQTSAKVIPVEINSDVPTSSRCESGFEVLSGPRKDRCLGEVKR